ncbi:MAG: NAD-dependent succinate-semialdehyde dehydrogenase [Bacteroidia bacterium]
MHLLSLLSSPQLLQNQAYINGEWRTAVSGEMFEVQNPATDEVITTVANVGKQETLQAIEAAYQAFQSWKQTSATERATLLRKWFDLMLLHQEDLAKILTFEQGKPLVEALGEIKYGASYLEWFAEEARRNYGDVIPAQEKDKRIVVIKQAVGVVGIITPWNFPNAMIARKVAAALAAGCTVVIKPSEFTPLSALAMCYLAEQAGIPKGVVNVVTTTKAAEVGETLTNHAWVRKISFTGSTAVGKLLLKQSADTVKKVTMELGGNAPFIVFEDAQIEEAVKGAMTAKFRNAGQTCVCANRIYVQNAVYEEFVAKFSAALATLKVGNGMDKGCEIGPLINLAARQKIENLLADAQVKGAQIIYDKAKIPNSPNFYPPTLVLNASPNMEISQTEIFGPVAAIYRFETEAEAIQLANDTEFGLAAYFYGQNIHRIWRVAEALEYGMVGINTGLISSAVAPFGGIKSSGFGREGSKYGLEDYVELKYLCFGGGRMDS